jgi:membrane-bound lytic murein transglycosylase A
VRRWAPLLALGLLASCAAPPQTPSRPPKLDLNPVSFAALPGWSEDRIAEALPAFLKSCAAPSPPADYASACAAAAALGNASDETARQFFESYFTPFAASDRGQDTALLTGYYEPLLKGARARGGVYQTPLLRRPPDLVSVDLGRFRPSWRGERIAGRVEAGKLVPYWSRAEIEAGALDRFDLNLVWVDDPVAAFFLEIQGSGRVSFADGGNIRLGYDGENGQPYVSIGRLLVEDGALTLDQVSAQSIKAWLASHPAAAKALLDRNPSYVFFRESAGDGPVGTQGVALTPGRSLAVDREFIALGVPVFVEAAQDGQDPTRRLTVAQDTGAAIRGPLRGDLFWGFGPEAEARAGAMRAQGRVYLLLPRAAPEKP